MENLLHARDKVGVQDFVLLENYTNETAFVQNLRKRFQENLIYVCYSFKSVIYLRLRYLILKYVVYIYINCLYLLIFKVYLSTLNERVC